MLERVEGEKIQQEAERFAIGMMVVPIIKDGTVYIQREGVNNVIQILV